MSLKITTALKSAKPRSRSVAAQGRQMFSVASRHVICLVGVLGFSSAALADDPIGKAEKIDNAVTGAIGSQIRALAVPDPVHRDESIRTADKAQAHLRFKDETDLRLGPNASIKLDAAVFSGKPDSAMDLATGTMRFVSGNGPKGSYQIKTPVATIGLRGTTVEVTIRNGRTYVSLHEGAAQVCTRTGRCMDLTNACTYLYVDARGVTLPQNLSRNVPTYSGQCTGDFCVVDRCTPQIAGTPGAGPAATPPRARPPKVTPPKAKPPKGKPPRKRPRGEVVEEYDVDEPVYLPPRGGILLPGFQIGPRFPGGGFPRPPGTKPPIGRMPGFTSPGGGNFRIR